MSVWRPQNDFDKLVEQIEITRRLKTGGFTVFNYTPSAAGKILPLCSKGVTRRQP